MFPPKPTGRGYALLHSLYFFYSLIALTQKAASAYPLQSGRFWLLYGAVLGMFFVYALLWQQAIKHFSLVTAYANRGAVLFWGMLWAALLYQEPIRWNNIGGAFLIACGMYLVNQDAP